MIDKHSLILIDKKMPPEGGIFFRISRSDYSSSCLGSTGGKSLTASAIKPNI